MKVFGIGFQRTGLMSLTAGLNMLGIKTIQFPKELFYDIEDEVIHRFDGFTDNPLPLVYKQLDERYPNSKFIHTVRDEEPWLKSAEWLFSVGAVKFKWHNHPYADEFHGALYGITHFDEEVFRQTYRKYNETVREYFRNRPEDCLVMDIQKGDGFDKLCPFLGKSIPSEPFPHSNRKENILKVRGRKIYREVRSGLRQILNK